MPDPEVVTPAATPEGAPDVPAEVTPPAETALTRTEVLSLIATAQKDVESRLRQDIETLSATTRRTAGNYGTANAKLQKLEAALEAVATRNMDESEARLWKAERAAERAHEATAQVSQQQEYDQAASAFQQRSAAYLATEGIKPSDERLTEAFKKYADSNPNTWDSALARAVADVHKSEAKRVSDEAKTAVEKAREEERAKLRNEQRASDGKLDKGQPASSSKVDFTSMSDEEFRAYDAQLTEQRLRRQRQTR